MRKLSFLFDIVPHEWPLYDTDRHRLFQANSSWACIYLVLEYGHILAVLGVFYHMYNTRARPVTSPDEVDCHHQGYKRRKHKDGRMQFIPVEYGDKSI